MEDKINIHFIHNPGYNASRVLKETKGIIDYGLFQKVIIIALNNKHVFKNTELEIDSQRKFIRLASIKNVSNLFIKRILRFFALPELCIKYILLCKKYKPKCINVHSILLLPLCVILKYLFKCKLIYDTHELETEVDGLGGLKKKVLKFSERLFIKYVDEVVVVGEKIGEWYSHEYGISNIHVIRNFPYKEQNFEESKKSLLKEEFDIPKEQLLFIYNGLLTTGRGIELTLEAFCKLNSKYHIIFMGYGPLVTLVKEYEFKYLNIHYKPAVLPSEVIQYTKGADIGIIIPENTCLSYYYGMPNKLFEYIHAGIPTVVSNFPEMSAIIDKYECGWKIEPTVETLLNCINRITKENIIIKCSKIYIAQTDLCWENELVRFKDIYN